MAAFLVLSGCGPNKVSSDRTGQSPAGSSSAAPSGVEAAARVQPAAMKAVVLFTEGTVTAQRSGSVRDLQIGDDLQPRDVIDVGGGASCEIQFGNMAVARLSENTKVTLASLAPGAQSGGVTVALSLGTVVSHVRKLGSEESYQVRTQSVTCGVRGTQFAVSSDSGGTTKLAVKDGAVAVLPPNSSIQAMKTDAATIGTDVEQAVQTVTSRLPVVKAGYQIVIPKAAGEAMSRQIDTMAKELNAAAAAPASDRAAMTASINRQASQTAASIQTAAPAPQTLDEQSIQTLKPTGQMQLRPLDQLPSENTPAPATVASAPVSQSGVQSAAKPPEKNNTPTPGGTTKAATLQAKPPVTPPVSASAKPPATPPVQAAAAAQPSQMPVTVITRPANAAVFINDKPIPAGGSRQLYRVGATITIRAERLGYASQHVSYTIVGGKNEIQFQLKPKPVDRIISLSSKPIVGLESGGPGSDVLYASDAEGAVYAVDSAGNVQWTVKTSNGPNDIALPVVSPRYVYFSGNAEFVIIDRQTGRVVRRQKSGAQTSHPFGQHVAFTGTGTEQVLYPETNGIRVMDAKTGALIRNIPIPGGVGMSPTVHAGKILVVSQKGEFFVIDPATGKVDARIPTQALQPIGLAVTTRGNRAVFAGRRGTVVCIDVAGARILWQKKLAGNPRVFSDILTPQEGVFVYTGKSIDALSWADGSPLYAPIQGITAPPVLLDGQLVAGHTSGAVRFYTIADGTVQMSYPVGYTVSARPALISGRVALPLSTGAVELLVPAGIAAAEQAR